MHSLRTISSDRVAGGAAYRVLPTKTYFAMIRKTSNYLSLDKKAAILADNIFKCIFLTKKCVLIKMSLKSIPND